MDSVRRMTTRERIRDLRKNLKLSVSKFASRINVPPQRVSDVELGRQKVPGEMLESIAQTFCVDANWLLTGKPFPGEQSETTQANNEICAYLIEQNKQLFAQNQRLIDQILKLTEREGS